MAVPPPRDEFFKFAFVVNSIWVGCVPPMKLIIETTHHTRMEFLKFILVADGLDIFTTMLRPYRKRIRIPNRHPHKKRFRPGFPDVDEYLAKWVECEELVEAVEHLPGSRWVLALNDAYQGIELAAYVVGTLVDLGYLPTIAYLEQDHQACVNLDRLERTWKERIITGGVGPLYQPINLPIHTMNQGFFDGSFGTTCLHSNAVISFGAKVQNNSHDIARGSLAIISDERGEIADSGMIEYGIGQVEHPTCAATFRQGETVSWVWKGNDGFVDLFNTGVLAFGEHGWLTWPLDLV